MEDVEASQKQSFLTFDKPMIRLRGEIFNNHKPRIMIIEDAKGFPRITV